MLSQLRSAESPPGVHICGVFLAALWSMVTGKMAAWENCLWMKNLKWNINKKLVIFFSAFFLSLLRKMSHLPPSLVPGEMQSPRMVGRKRGRPPLQPAPIKVAVHNLYSAPAGALPVVKIPKKRGRKPGHKVDTWFFTLLHLLLVLTRLLQNFRWNAGMEAKLCKHGAVQCKKK